MLILSFALGVSLRAFAPARNVSSVFDNTCAACHLFNDAPRVPTVAALRERSPESILNALTTGAMRQQGGELTDAQRRAVAEFLSGRSLASASASSDGRCA